MLVDTTVVRDDNDNLFTKAQAMAAAIGKRIYELMSDESMLISDRDEDNNPVKRRVCYKDIVILLRSTSSFAEQYKKTLEEMGIPVISESKTGFFEAHEIQNLISYLKIIDNPLQDIPLANVLKSSFVGISEHTLANIRIIAKEERYYYHALLRYVDTYKDDKRRKEIPKLLIFLEKLALYRKKAKTTDVYEILYDLYYTEGYYDLCTVQKDGEKKKANLDALLKKTYSFISSGSRSIYEYVDFIDSLKSGNIDMGEAGLMGEGSDAVRIMTIHKSKGLEFPIVFVSNLGNDFNLKDSGDKCIIDDKYGLGVDDFNYDLHTKKTFTFKKYLAQRTKKLSKEEEQRVLYVALTRAKEKLIMVGDFRAGLKEDKEIADSYTELFDKHAQAYLTDYKELESKSNYLDWILGCFYEEIDFMPLVSAYVEQLSIYRLHSDKSTLRADKLDLMYEYPSLSIRILHRDNVLEYDSTKATDEKKRKESKTKIFDESISLQIVKLLRAQRDYHYPYEEERLTKAKKSVSELKNTSYQSEGFTLMHSDFEENYPTTALKQIDNSSIDGASLGTLYHIFMFDFDFTHAKDYQDEAYIESCIEKLIKKEVITKEQADNLDKKKFVSLSQNSDYSLIERIMSAAVKGKCFKEQPFLKEYVIDGKKTIVQGIIDLFFVDDDGELILIDYKTDKMSGNPNWFKNKLIDRYKEQFKYYSEALEGLLKKRVKEMYIYSFTLDKFINVTIDN
jgi:ATP-dependent helicase/nuclease subunit A